MRSIKCVVIGDGAVGKTSLLISYTTNTFPQDYVPTVFDNYTTTVALKDEHQNTNLFKLNLWDTAGQEEYDNLRPLSYPQTDIFLICFAVNNRFSFTNIADKWLPELLKNGNLKITYKSTKLPILLVGTKSDLRDEPDCEVENDEILKMVKEKNFLGYVECSAKEQIGVKEVFENSIKLLVAEEEPEQVAESDDVQEQQPQVTSVGTQKEAEKPQHGKSTSATNKNQSPSKPKVKHKNNKKKVENRTNSNPKDTTTAATKSKKKLFSGNNCIIC